MDRIQDKPNTENNPTSGFTSGWTWFDKSNNLIGKLLVKKYSYYYSCNLMKTAITIPYMPLLKMKETNKKLSN